MSFQPSSFKRSFMKADVIPSKKQNLHPVQYALYNEFTLYGPLIINDMGKLHNSMNNSKYHMDLYQTGCSIVENFLEKLASVCEPAATSSNECKNSEITIDYIFRLPWRMQTIVHKLENMKNFVMTINSNEVIIVYEQLQRLSSEIEKLDSVMSIRNQSNSQERSARNG